VIPEMNESTREIKSITMSNVKINCLSKGNHFEMQIVYCCNYTDVTQFLLKTRCVFLGAISDLFSFILRLGVLSDKQISTIAKNLRNEFKDFNPTKLAGQNETFKILFASDPKCCNRVYNSAF